MSWAAVWTPLWVADGIGENNQSALQLVRKYSRCTPCTIRRGICRDTSVDYTFVDYTFVDYTFVDYTFVDYTLVDYTLVDYTLVGYTLVHYTLVDYTLVDYTLVDYTLVDYTLVDYTLVDYTLVDWVGFRVRVRFEPSTIPSKYAVRCPQENSARTAFFL